MTSKEALDVLIDAKFCRNAEHENEVNEAIEVLQELVDKVTPTKPLIEADGFYDGELVYDTWVCQKCGERYEIDYDKYDYCPKCGQALDWSKNE